MSNPDHGTRTTEENVHNLASPRNSLSEGFHDIPAARMEQLREATLEKLHKARVIVPMREKGPVIQPFLEATRMRVPITVINDGSDDIAIDTVRRFDLEPVDRNAILEAVDWGRLLDVLHLDAIPRGKGTTVFAGYLYTYGQNEYGPGENPKWIIQHDAELAVDSQFTNIDYIGAAMTMATDATRHIKIAKAGRNNEIVMSHIAGLGHTASLLRAQGLHEQAQRAMDLHNRLQRYKWILTGQFGLRMEEAMNRPFGTGYLEEILTATFVEDTAAVDGTDPLLQVVNRKPCPDGLNSYIKELIMMQKICAALTTMTFFGKPTNEWTINDVATVNGTMTTDINTVMIPDHEGPMETQIVPNERVIPSVTQLVSAGIVKEGVLKDLVQSYN